ncbi:MAG: hypothetical protein AAFY56_14055, partial [Pseudomonadota bacterium]
MVNAATIVAGSRANQFVPVYETVAAMLADNLTGVAVGELILAGNSAFRVVTTGEHFTNAGGLKLVAEQIAHGYDVRDFGALCDGSTDDTAAFEAACTAALAERHKSVLVTGDMVFDAINTRWDNGLRVFVSGALSPTSQIQMAEASLVGIGGGPTKQFRRNYGARIDDTGDFGVAKILGVGNSPMNIENVEVQTADYGIELTHFYDGADNGGANFFLKHVNATGNATGDGYALKIGSVFWVYIEECTFTGLSDAFASILIDAPDSISYAGLINIRRTVTSGKGNKVSSSTTRVGPVTIFDCDHELLPSGEYGWDFAPGADVDHITIDNFLNADNLSGSLGSFNFGNAKNVQVRDQYHSNVDAPKGGLYIQRMRDIAGFQQLAQDEPQTFGLIGGSFSGRALNRGRYPIRADGVGYDVQVPTGSLDGGDLNIASGAPDPAGGTEGFQVTTPGTVSGSARQ